MKTYKAGESVAEARGRHPEDLVQLWALAQMPHLSWGTAGTLGHNSPHLSTEGRKLVLSVSIMQFGQWTAIPQTT